MSEAKNQKAVVSMNFLALRNLFQFIPLKDEPRTDTAELVEHLLVMNHLYTIQTRNRVILAEKNCLLWADLFTKAAIDATSHVDIEVLRAFLHFLPPVFLRNFHRLDGDGSGRTDELTELASDTTLFAMLVGNESRSPTIPIGKISVPLLLGILHGDDPLIEDCTLEVVPSDYQTREDCRQIETLYQTQFRTINDECHSISRERSSA
jgi:hypothetical protein